MRTLGTGPRPTLLLHPYLVPGRLYDQLVEPWLHSHTFYVPDYPGYGDNGQMEGPYTLQRYATWVAHQLQQLPPMPCLGYSMGGVVAQLLVAMQPESITRLVLACTFAHKPQTLTEKAQKLAFAPLVQRLGGRGLAGVMYSELRKSVSPTKFDTRQLRLLVAANRTDVITRNAEEIFGVDTRTLLPHIQQPTLVIAGAKDWVIPAHHTRQLAERIPHAQLLTIPDAAHFLPFTHREAFWPPVMDFLDQ